MIHAKVGVASMTRNRAVSRLVSVLTAGREPDLQPGLLRVLQQAAGLRLAFFLVGLALFAVITLVLGFEASQLKVDAGFEKQLPLKHPYIQTFLKYQDEFGGANRLLIAVKAEQGDIFTPEFFKVMKDVSDAVFLLPGVNRSTVSSIFTPNVRFVEIVEGGFAGGNVVPADFTPTPEMLAAVRENILKSGQVGRLVANDFTAAR
jgi:predicted RND superfamily exporter protein